MQVQVLNKSSWQQVAAFQWLTGWPQENLMDPLHGPTLMVPPFYASAAHHELEAAERPAPHSEPTHCKTLSCGTQATDCSARRCGTGHTYIICATQRVHP